MPAFGLALLYENPSIKTFTFTGDHARSYITTVIYNARNKKSLKDVEVSKEIQTVDFNEALDEYLKALDVQKSIFENAT